MWPAFSEANKLNFRVSLHLYKDWKSEYGISTYPIRKLLSKNRKKEDRMTKVGHQYPINESFAMYCLQALIYLSDKMKSFPNVLWVVSVVVVWFESRIRFSRIDVAFQDNFLTQGHHSSLGVQMDHFATAFPYRLSTYNDAG